jgi:aquaporin Z
VDVPVPPDNSFVVGKITVNGGDGHLWKDWVSPLVAEALGTFTLVFAGTGAIVINHVTGGSVTHVGIGLTFGLVVMALIHTFGPVSGAHMNPAVSIGLWTAGLLHGPAWPASPRRELKLSLYIVTQCAAACLASFALLILFADDLQRVSPDRPDVHLGATLPRGAPLQTFWIELLLTWFLMLAVLQVVTGPADMRPLVGMVIGGVVGLEAIFAGPITGASMNPARSLGPALVSGHWQHLWIYWIACPLGALLAVPCHHLMKRDPGHPPVSFEPD